MAKWVMSGKPRTILDPAAGLGGLLSACHRLDHHVQLAGVERDSETLQRAKRTAPQGTKLIRADYLKSEAGQFGGIIANPPYVKAHRLDYSQQDWQYFEERMGTPLDRLTNLYALFLLKIWEDLAPRGRAAVILPAEFLNANFGVEVKERLVRSIRPPLLMVFAPSVNLFEGALTTSAILFLEKGRLPTATTRATCVKSVEEALRCVDRLCAGIPGHLQSDSQDLSALRPRDKWLNVLLNRQPLSNDQPFPRRIGDYFDCRRGIATGANDYFCLKGSELRMHQLTGAHTEPCITKAIDAKGLVFTPEKLAVLVARDRRCLLLNPSHSGAHLLRYLNIGEQRGIPQRHLPSHRPVWYLPENRPVADIWVAVFSRESPKFILNTSGAKNLTCFHGLYAKPGCETLPPLMTLFLNSFEGRRAFAAVNRFYGDGLNKLEPKDVESMGCPTMPKLSQAQAAELIRKLTELEELPTERRTSSVSELAARHFAEVER